MRPAEALAYAMRNVDPTVPEQSIDRFDMAAAEDILRRLGHLHWRLVPADIGITRHTTAAAVSARPAAAVPKCHPERPHKALGLCAPCYEERRRRLATRSDG